MGETCVVSVVPPDIDARRFFEEFVSRRVPAVVDGLLTDPEWRAHARWTDAYLAAAAGAQAVRVERRADDGGGAFGRGRTVRMRFGEFLRRAGAGDERLYLSAQPLPEGVDGPTELHAPPLRGRLSRDAPIRPRLLGRLVPQQLNMWMGSSAAPSSSGLHHDFHDNLYVLLRGRKRFALYPPHRAREMATVGQIERVHANGLVSYARVPTRADGLARVLLARRPRARSAPLTAGRAAALLDAAEAALGAACARGARGAELAALERAVDVAEAAMDAAMEAALDGGGCSDDASGSDDDNGTDTPGAHGRARAGGERLPDNFCTRPPPCTLRPLIVELRAGQMLYLPASWFHEVSSSDAREQVGGAREVGHLALNYWLHPPDTADFDAPYAHAHWQRRFDRLFARRALAARTRWRAGRLAALAARTAHPARRRRAARG
ncbi:hypothetical protein KFE25_001319 [Diacronema lutheri]|uniref:JmjC domain-containing protein n=1 Tax=Diacronema lutheri TaxID=2081491 RepID=A0A8J5XA48_DIALT|nr:hypothetical protein KFE25_001319 [Diacronema lutheri]